MTPDCRAGAAAQPGSARRLRVIERQGRRRRLHGRTRGEPRPRKAGSSRGRSRRVQDLPHHREVLEAPRAAPERVHARFLVAPPAEKAAHGAIPRTAVRRSPGAGGGGPSDGGPAGDAWGRQPTRSPQRDARRWDHGACGGARARSVSSSRHPATIRETARARSQRSTLSRGRSSRGHPLVRTSCERARRPREVSERRTVSAAVRAASGQGVSRSHARGAVPSGGDLRAPPRP